MATRREAMQAGIGATILGAVGGSKVFSRADTAGNMPSMPPPSGYAEQGCDPCTATPTAPLVERGKAMARIFGDAVLKGQVRARLYEQFRGVNEIDPDLLVLKSLSPMAKLAITRQRRVESEMQKIYTLAYDHNVPQPYSPMRDFLESHVRKLMWGHD